MKKFKGFTEGNRYLVLNSGAYNPIEIEILQITKYAIKYIFHDKSGETVMWRLKEEFVWVPLEKLRNVKNIKGIEHGRTNNGSD